MVKRAITIVAMIVIAMLLIPVITIHTVHETLKKQHGVNQNEELF